MGFRTAALAFLVIFISQTGWAQTDERVIPSKRVTTFVHIRSAPDSDSAEKGRLQIGQSLPLVQSVPRWYEVRLPDGSTGFVTKAWTTVTHPLGARQVDELRIHFLNIGTGTCTVVECPGAGAPPLIVDCGSLAGTPNDMDAAAARTYVQNILSGSSQRPNLVLSHADRDHYGFISTVLTGTQTDQIWQGGNPDDYSEDSFPTWIAGQVAGGATVHNGFPPHFSNNGQPIGNDLSCGLANTFVLTVNTGTAKNAQSLVLMLEYHEFTAILTGDAEGETESRAINNFSNNLKATVLAGSHHGADTKGSNGVGWITATAPEVAIFSAGQRFGHPRCTTTGRFSSTAASAEHDVRCGTSNTTYGPVTRTARSNYMTAVSGTVIVSTNGHSPMALHCTRSSECGIKIPH